ncbi:hypothetical protein TSUD_15060 [Trifolium subterraneum]|uniref:Reverse transcriptase domain-containing protein n=1 Tax=Trifolium subterraneum TaxID=3900 RepID=A0A2Z6MTA4_TRISU|nr:hypothetical protein TSUD_15060 [Trifolium subterraneum]
MEDKIVMLKKEVERLDLKREEGSLVGNENEVQKDTLLELRHLLHSKDSLLFQQPRSRWLKEGDANTGYFHSCITSRKRSNVIGALLTDGGWVDKPREVRGEIVGYFKSHFAEVRWRRPRLDGVEFPILTSLQSENLIRPFSADEVWSVVAESDGNKSPGPDGFNFAFLKGSWEVISNDVLAFMHEFHSSTLLPKAFSSYFVTLIPKILNPQSLGDFRPISLLGCFYKLVAKVLTKRLSTVMDSLTSKNQSAFLKGRLLVDGVLAINEVVDWVKKTKKECLVFKVDFEKAYDSVSWSFLEYMLRRFGFDGKWRSWIKACVFSGSLSVLVNGSPTEQIDICKGLKQGDPLAPFLFILVAEGLGALMKKAVGLGFYKGVQLSNSGAIMSHLQYADDTLFIGETCVENLWTTKAILRWFELISGLKVNFFKSKLYGINEGGAFVNSAASFLNCKVGKLPFIYLGLPVGANPRRVATWNPVLEVLQKRLASWKNKYVSLGGRVVLLNSTEKGGWPRGEGFADHEYLSFDKVEMETIIGGGVYLEECASGKEELRDLSVNVLTPIELTNVEDEWKCHYSIGGLFSVSSLYKFLSGIIIPPISLDPELVRDLGTLWESLAPSKVIVFSWQLLFGRIPTRVNLAKRGIVEHGYNSFCVLCPWSLECEGHLFGWCAFASTIWRKVFNWFGWDEEMPRDPSEIFQRFSRGGASGRRHKGLIAVWHSVVWTIWRARNELIFNAKVPAIEDELQGIMSRSWKWLLEKKKGGSCSLYEWKTCPMDCILR